jgi:hypothetical protein
MQDVTSSAFFHMHEIHLCSFSLDWKVGGKTQSTNRPLAKLACTHVFFSALTKVSFAGSQPGSSVPSTLPDEIDCTCALSQQLLTDPVVIEDEPRHFYERSLIQRWFDECKSRNRPITSPMTRKEVRPSLRDSPEMKNRVLQAWHRATFKAPLDDSILALRGVFAVLDPLRDVLSETLRGWQPL